MSTDEDYVYDEASGEWVPASELAAQRAAEDVVEVRDAGGFKFRRQHPAGDHVIDFFCPKAKLAIEVDGRAHDGEEASRRDANRSAFLKSRGIATLRVPARVILEEMEVAVARIVEICSERANVPLHRPSDGPPPRAGEDLE